MVLVGIGPGATTEPNEMLSMTGTRLVAVSATICELVGATLSRNAVPRSDVSFSTPAAAP